MRKIEWDIFWKMCSGQKFQLIAETGIRGGVSCEICSEHSINFPEKHSQ